uniref:DUF2471 family protein n=1 Tax=Caballeronia sp. LjRoot34 TaxID=3342325 RepID=UPI003F50B1EE
MDVLFAADAAVREAVPAVVQRHRTAGVLTWALLHKIEGEVLAEVAASGNHSKRILDMIRAPDALGYPKDDRPASFVGHDFVPIVFGAIEDAWRRVNEEARSDHVSRTETAFLAAAPGAGL